MKKYLATICASLPALMLSAEEHMESEARCDKPRVAGGPDVLSESAALSQAETKCKAAEPASSHLWKPWCAA